MLPFILAIVSGLLLIAALPPHDLWWCGWFALVPLLVAIGRSGYRRAGLLGWLAGTVTNLGAFHWLVPVMLNYSSLGIFSYLVMLGAALYQGVPLALWALLLRSGWTAQGWKRGFGLVTAVLAYPALEYFYPILFPWYLANTQHNVPSVLGLVEMGGCGLLSLLLVGVNLVLARLLWAALGQANSNCLWPARCSRRELTGMALGALFALAITVVYSEHRNSTLEELVVRSEKFEVGLVQPNHWIGEGSPMEDLFDYQKMTSELVESQSLDLVVWPESAVRTPPGLFLSSRGPGGSGEPGFPLDVQEIRQSSLQPGPDFAGDRAPSVERLSIQRGHKTPILFGTALLDTDPEAEEPVPGRAPTYNCAVLLDESGKVVGAAAKVKLLLFGETVPLASYFPSVYRLIPLASALLPGEGPTTLKLRQARLGVMICYEDILPWFHFSLARQNPQVLMNLTNDAWFGKTAEAEAHLALAKLRAVEGRVYLVRATSTGVSAVVDPLGRVVGRVEQDERATLKHKIALLDVRTGFERWGDSVAWLGLIWLVGFLLIRRTIR